MRPPTDASAGRGALGADRPQSDLFVEDLIGPDAPAGHDSPGDKAPARRGRRRIVADDFGRHAGEPLQVPIDQLDDNPPHPRDHYPPECLDELARDIAQRGVLPAIVVAPPDAQGRFRIRFGVQRWRAARLAGLTTVPVAVRVQPCEAYDQVAENLKRHDLSPLELARFIRGRVEAGECSAQIARKLGDRLNPRKADLHRWRETFAEKLRGYGIEAEASRQATRGVTRNFDPIWRVKARNEARLRETKKDEKAGRPAALSRSEALRALGRIADALGSSDLAEDRHLASEIHGFVRRQPVVQRVMEQKRKAEPAVRPAPQREIAPRQERQWPEIER